MFKYDLLFERFLGIPAQKTLSAKSCYAIIVSLEYKGKPILFFLAYQQSVFTKTNTSIICTNCMGKNVCYICKIVHIHIVYIGASLKEQKCKGFVKEME